MNKFLFLIISYFIVISGSILIMIFGWGLKPVSWGWVIGGNLILSFIGSLFQLAD